MDLVSRAGTALHPVEVDLLCTFAEVDAPFPIDVPASGESEVERAVLYRDAAASMRERGLADERGPLDVAEEFVYLLRACTGVLDLVVTTDAGTRSVAVLTARDDALVVSQDSADTFGMVRMLPTTVDDAVDRLARLVPRTETPLTTPFTLPRRAVRSAFDAMVARMPDDGGEPEPMTAAEIDELLRANGITDRVASRMVAALTPRSAAGRRAWRCATTPRTSGGGWAPS
ncbi:ESX secretion-associated protein EspG [Actinokineospora soli]|uniref:ESX secretion-associated protein EspG n=1 Tax=Actinokineospora soli TaxID=1048753 RepID=A0ABW2TJS2_9PSEU